VRRLEDERSFLGFDTIVTPQPGCALPGASCATQMCCRGSTCDPVTKTCQSIIL